MRKREKERTNIASNLSDAYQKICILLPQSQRRRDSLHFFGSRDESTKIFTRIKVAQAIAFFSGHMRDKSRSLPRKTMKCDYNICRHSILFFINFLSSLLTHTLASQHSIDQGIEVVLTWEIKKTRLIRSR